MTPDPAREIHVAVVHTRDEVVYLAASPTRDLVVREVAGYVAAHASRHLWEDDARRVASSLAADDVAAAVETYFGALCDPGRRVRWVHERLVLRALPVSGGVAIEG